VARGEARQRPTAASRIRGAFTSVRVQVTLMATVLVAVALLAAGLGLLATLTRMLEHSGDMAARGRARDLAALVEADALPRVIRGSGEESLIQVVGPTGKIEAASRGLFSEPPIGGPAPRGDKPEARNVDFLDGRDFEPYRVWTLRVDGRDGTYVVHVGNSLEAAEEAVATVRELLLVWFPPLTALLAVGAWVTVGRALRPVEAIRAKVADISGTALDRRAPVPAGDDEISRLARTMNAMLDRLEESSRRQRRFVADASHELQSPLTALRTELEVALSHPDRMAWQTWASELLADTGRMERLVRDLLLLAQADESRTVAQPTEVDLDVVVLEEVARARSSTAVSLDATQVSAAPVRGSKEELTRLVRNLLENAGRYATSAVRVTVGTENGSVRLTVDDDGTGVPAEHRQRVFERFVRLDAARPRGNGGTGLGLAIVREIAERHGGSVDLEDAPGGGARFVVVLAGS
jgi:signal transduction histidine kinase